MNITNERAHEMIAYLRGLASGEVLSRYKENGLCENFRKEFNIRIQHLVCFQDFPEYSGFVDFPVKSPNEEMDPEEAYDAIPNLWIGRYGKSRKRFCAWCADQIENDYL